MSRYSCLILLIFFECVLYAYLLSVPEPDPIIFGSKIYNLRDEWTIVASDPLLSSELKPIPPINDHWKDANTIIFVSIPHYRDPRCATTVKNLLLKAKHPHRLRFGIIQQRHTEEDFFKCVDDVTTDLQAKKDSQGAPLLNEKQFRLIEFTHQQATGPNFARSFSKQLLQEEDEFCLSVDAHSDVAQNWDEELLTMWAATENEFAILSTQPPDISQLKGGSGGKVPHLCRATVDKSGKIINLPPTIASDLVKPILSPLYSEAFAFSKCHAMKKVPNDPFMEVFYDGDEFAKLIRLWTKGYDIYTPNKAVVFHDYHRKLPVIRATNKEISPMEWNIHPPSKKDAMREKYDRTIDRIDHLYGSAFLTESNAFLSDDEVIEEIVKMRRYGILTTPSVESSGLVVLKRDLFDFMKFTGINTIKREVFADRCGDLEWIPSYTATAAPNSGAVKVDPWIDELNVLGFSAAERLSVTQDHIPFPSPSSQAGDKEAVKLVFYGLEDFTRLPVLLASGGDAVSGALPSAAVVEESGSSEGSDRGSGRGSTPLPNKQQHHRSHESVADVVRDVASRLVPSLDAHRGGELWFVFQWLDSVIEQTINRIDLDLGFGHGHRVMRIFLLFFPLIALLIGLAVYMLLPSDRRARYFSYSADETDLYKVK